MLLKNVRALVCVPRTRIRRVTVSPPTENESAVGIDLPVRHGKVTLKLKTASSWCSHVEYRANRAAQWLGLDEIGNGRKLSSMHAERP
jgi:hypothetical protein